MTDAGERFVLFGMAHVVALGIVFIACITTAFFSKRPFATRHRSKIAMALAVGLLMDEAVVVASGALREGIQPAFLLPFHLCDISMIALFIALLWQKQFAFEIAYFFGVGGVAVALFTPNLTVGFPSFLFVRFFISHVLILLGVTFLCFAYRMRPQPGALVRMLAVGHVYFLGAALVNWVLGTNYGYLAHKPDGATALDGMGPWPFYLIGIWIIGVSMLFVMALPWRFYREEK